MSFAQSKMPDHSKKRTLDPNDPAAYWPISNLSFVSNVADATFAAHAARHSLLPIVHLAYLSNHSTETTVISTIDQGHISALMLLDLYAAFDTIDHQILADVLRWWFGTARGTF